MRHYEIMLVLHPERHDEMTSIVDRYEQLLQSTESKIYRLEDFQRTLAYPINNLNKANYILLNLQCTPEVAQQLQAMVEYNDAVLRYFRLQQKQAASGPSVLYNKNSTLLRKKTKEGDAASTPAEEIVIKTEDKSAKKGKFRALPEITSEELDYKNVDFLSHFLTDTKKIARHRVTGASRTQQRRLSQAIKRARFLGLLPHCDKYAQPVVY